MSVGYRTRCLQRSAEPKDGEQIMAPTRRTCQRDQGPKRALKMLEKSTSFPKVRSTILLALAFSIAAGAGALCQTKRNPYASTLPIVPPNMTPQYNAYTGRMEAAPAGSRPQYNTSEGKWQMAPQGSATRYNPYTGRYELAPPGSRLQISPYTGGWYYGR